jgi:drug/metabolite transporter (DMT)-like permease
VISALKRRWVQLSLVATAVVWGATFVTVKGAVEHFPMYSFMAWRFSIGVVAFVVLFPSTLRKLNLRVFAAGTFTGAFLCLGYIFQTWGLTVTTASKAAFITGMFVVITPVMQSLFLRRLPAWKTAIGAVVAVAGLWLLSGGASGWNVGDTRVLLCAVAYSAHMIAIGALGKRHDVLAYTFVQLLVTAIACAVIAALVEPPMMPSGVQVWGALLLTGVLATAVAFAVQTYAQRTISPARTALILVTEPAFGGLFGWLAGEQLGVRGLAGAALILVGMVAAELVGTTGVIAEKTALEVAVEGPAVPLVEAGEEGV